MTGIGACRARYVNGAYRRDGDGRLRFVPVPAPSAGELDRLVQRIAERIGRSLERSGLITRDIENAYLAFAPGFINTNRNQLGMLFGSFVLFTALSLSFSLSRTR